MKISVLIAAYHADPFIFTALDCLRRQTHLDWEVIVVEDGSRDRTERIVQAFAASLPQPVRYHNLGTNLGVGAARNKLLDMAAGDAVAFLDADDTWEPAHLANAAQKLKAGADFVVSGVRTFDLKNHATIESVPAPLDVARDPVRTLFERSAIITSSAVVLTKALADRTGRFDPALRIGEDRDFWLRCALQGGRFAVTESLTCNYAKHGASSMSRTYVVAQQITQFYEKYRTLSAVPARLRRRLLADSLISMGRLLRDHDAPASARCFWRAWRCEPFNPSIPVHLAFTGWRSMANAHAA